MLKTSIEREGKVWELMEHQTKSTFPTLIEGSQEIIEGLPGYQMMKHTPLVPVTGPQADAIIQGRPLALMTKKLKEVYQKISQGYQCMIYLDSFSTGVQDVDLGFDYGMIVRYRPMIILSYLDAVMPISGAWYLPETVVDETTFLNSSLFTATKIKVETIHSQEATIG